MKYHKLNSIIISLIMVLFIACNASNSNSKNVDEQIIVFARGGDSVSLDPGKETDGESFYPTRNIYEGLTRFVAEDTSFEPSLAESWDISSDNLTYTFHLRQGVKFHDGTDFNADAVVFSLARQFKPEHEAYDYGPYQYWGYMSLDDIVDDIVKIDDYKVELRLKKVDVTILANLAMDFASIVSPTAFRASKAEFKNNPVGTGPFKFVSWTKDDNIVLERNDAYWDGEVKLDRVIIKTIPDSTARWLALQKGEIDMMQYPSVEDLSAIEADPNIKMYQEPGLNVAYLAFNIEREPFGNKLVRQAINYGINKDEILDVVYGELGISEKNPIPSSMWSYNDEIEAYDYDLEKARELLSEAGLANGFDMELWAMPVVRPYMPNARKTAEIIQAQLADLNINVEIVSKEWGSYLDGTSGGQHQAAMLGWSGDNGDPDNFLAVLLSADATKKPAGNIAFWRNTEFTDLINQAKGITNQEERSVLYKQAQVIFHEEAPWVVLGSSKNIVATNNKVKGFRPTPLDHILFKNVWIESD